MKRVVLILIAIFVANCRISNFKDDLIEVSIDKQYTVVPDLDDDNDVVGCTGGSLNTRTNEYVISYYSYAKTSELWFYKTENLKPYSPYGIIKPTPSRIISLKGLIYHIQGNAYDPETNTYWVIGTRQPVSKGSARRIIRVDDNGQLLESYDLSEYNFEAGMIALSPDYKNLLIKPNNKTWLLEIDKKTKVKIRQVEANMNEGLGVDFTTGFVYTADDYGHLYKRDYSDLHIVEQWKYKTLLNKPSNTQNVEAMIALDGKIYMVFDAYLHGKNPNGNCMWLFDLNSANNKNRIDVLQ